MPLTDSEHDTLVEAFHRSPLVRYGRWDFNYDHPGFFSYVHESGKTVYFTPDFNDDGYVDIQIVRPHGERAVWFDKVLYPRPLTPGGLFHIVQPYLVETRRRHRRSRKDWDPRMSGRKDWDPRAEVQPWAVRDFEMFLNAYIEAALWSSFDESGEPLDAFANASDIATETRREMGKDAQSFMAKNWEDIKENLIRAGVDFWLTRNHHGSGFWDGDPWEKEVGKRLTKNAHEYGEYNLYVGDDGRIHG